ncbi:MAG: zinc dependent phospholipase C family protein [Candidatus Acidiferrum sp.]
MLTNRFRQFTALALLLMLSMPCWSYSPLTHEAIIDSAWKSNIVPLLRARFPNSSDDDILHAKAYAYGGSIIQDVGYYPHGSKLFSDLTHYFRSGDFVVALLSDSQDVNEYAFALGALAHYASDNNGHHLSTNLAVPILYPKLRNKYGSVVTYEDDPIAHVKTEFAFDVLEVAQGRYTAENYHNFIGFNVSIPLLERAFLETYGLQLNTIVPDEERSMNSYRNTVGGLLPKATRIAWALKKNEIQKDMPGITRKKFLYNLSRNEYEKDWGKNYQTPTLNDKALAFLTRLLPKVGPLRILAFRTPTPETEKLFESSFNVSLEKYRGALLEVSKGQLKLPNSNFDVGAVTQRGQYHLSDKTCAVLLDRLAANQFAEASLSLRADLIAYFSSPDRSHTKRENLKADQKIQEQLHNLEQASFSTSSKAEPLP